ncbi:hypothetical protein MKEN_00612600 [Mycena kentingensis (nom. inval.)]|nr:hypothetical protein MKEN_00612600 [Mycena kentingensis (nom. inval.)]
MDPASASAGAPISPSAYTVPILVGTMMNWGLMGVLLIQIAIYYTALPNDLMSSKIVVAVVLILEVLQTAGCTRDTLRTLGSGWGNFRELDNVGWSWLSVPVLGSSVAFIGQLFFAWRIWNIARTWIVPACIATISSVQLGFAIATGMKFRDGRFFSKLSSGTLFELPVVWLATTAATDVLIASATVYYLHIAREKSLRGMNPLLDSTVKRIVIASVDTGLLCAVCAIFIVSIFVGYDGNNYHLSLCLWLSKVYSNSILAILNLRVTFRPRPSTSSVIGSLRVGSLPVYDPRRTTIQSPMTFLPGRSATETQATDDDTEVGVREWSSKLEAETKV